MADRAGGWVPIYSDLTRHPKTCQVAAELRIKQHGPQAVAGYLATLWAKASAERVPVAGGPVPERSIEHWAEWGGKHGAFVKALLSAGYIERRLDGVYFHDWEEGAGRLALARARWRRNKNNVRADVRAESNAEFREDVRALDQIRSDQIRVDRDLSDLNDSRSESQPPHFGSHSSREMPEVPLGYDPKQFIQRRGREDEILRGAG